MINSLGIKVLEKILGLKYDFKTIEEKEAFQLKRLKSKLKKAYKTPFYHERFDRICKEKNINFKELIKSIKNLDDFKRLIPYTERIDLQEHAEEMITSPLEKLINTHTSGTTTNKSVNIYSNKIDAVKVGLSYIKLFNKANLDNQAVISFVLPDTSSTYKAANHLRMVMPNIKIINLNKITLKDIIEIIQSDGLLSYTNIPLQLFKKYEDDIKEFINNNGKINLKTIIGVGDFLAKKAKPEIERILGKKVLIANQYAGIESQGLTYVCNKENTHVMSGNYFTELRPLPDEYFKSKINNLIQIAESSNEPIISRLESIIDKPLKEMAAELRSIKTSSEMKQYINDAVRIIEKSLEGTLGEIVITNIHASAMPLIRYPLGDVVELINCNCSDKVNQPVRIISRVNGMKKHFNIESIIRVIYSTQAFNNNKISGKGYVEYEMGESKPIISIYLEKGEKFNEEEKELINKDFFNSFSKAEEYALEVGAGGQWKIWDFKLNFIDKYEGVKWKVIYK